MNVKKSIFLAGLCISSLLVLVVGKTQAGETNVFGPNLVPNHDFENWADGKPVGWEVMADPADAVRISADTAFKVDGKCSLKLDVPVKGAAGFVLKKGIPVEPGVKYLFALSYRLEGFGEKGKYSGVDSSVRLVWLDSAERRIAEGGILAFPYHSVAEWDMRDIIVTAPDGVASVMISCGFNNESEKQTGKIIPSAMWIDAVHLMRYSPPADPETAKRKIEKIAEMGRDKPVVESYNLSSMRYGKISEIVSDSVATEGTCIKALTGTGKGLIAHSPGLTGPTPGLYRAVIRARTSTVEGCKAIGSFEISSENSAIRAGLEISTGNFTAPGNYQDIAVDFIHRTPGRWQFTVGTEGNVEWYADTVRIYPLKCADKELIEIFPGMSVAESLGSEK